MHWVQLLAGSPPPLPPPCLRPASAPLSSSSRLHSHILLLRRRRSRPLDAVSETGGLSFPEPPGPSCSALRPRQVLHQAEGSGRGGDHRSPTAVTPQPWLWPCLSRQSACASLTTRLVSSAHVNKASLPAVLQPASKTSCCQEPQTVHLL